MQRNVITMLLLRLLLAKSAKLTFCSRETFPMTLFTKLGSKPAACYIAGYDILMHVKTNIARERMVGNGKS